MADRRTQGALRPEPAATLAALRMVVPALVLLGPELREGVRVAALDPALRVAPEGLGWFARSMPIGPGLATGVELVAVLAALLAIVGIRARPALVVLTLAAGYLFALAELTGWVWHDMHLLWLTALLAASPCDHVLAVDAKLPEGTEGAAYTWPLLFARLLLGAVYFFPGVHKLARSGLAWALSDNLRNQLYWKWAEHGVVPLLRLDAHPGLLQAGALFVLVFELVAPVLFLVRRTRVVGAVLGVAFHLLAQAVLRIPFLGLWGCYVMLFDLRPLAARVRRVTGRPEPVVAAPSGGTLARSGSVPAVVVGALLLVGAIVQGARAQMQAFPFACYPTFEWRAGPEMPDLRMVAILPGGREVEVPHARDASGNRTQRQWATVWSLTGEAGVTTAHDAAGAGRARLLAYYLAATRAEPARSLARGAVRVRFLVVHRSVLPEDQGRAPVREELLAEMPVR